MSRAETPRGSDGRSVLSDVQAVSLDFFNTLVFHREGSGRGPALIDYLEAHGYEHAPWEHRILYEVFDEHDARYAPDGPREDRRAYYEFLAGRVFGRLEVPTSNGDAARHALDLWEILGPASLEVFPDAWRALSALREDGYPVVIVSNWQCGLRHFCAELGLSDQVDHIIGSADLGAAKPDGAIFEEACSRLGMGPERIVHVGDSLPEDYRGGEAAGLKVLLLQRDAEPRPGGTEVVRSLDELPALLRGPPEGGRG